MTSQCTLIYNDMSNAQFHIGGHPVWRRDQILTLEECVGKSGPIGTQSLNTDQAMQELNNMLQEDRENRNSIGCSGSSSCSDPKRDSRSGSPPEDEKDDDDKLDYHNPATMQFTEDDLKPSLIQKKARKLHVKDEDKDDRYWEKRKKNNMAAKRSREARRSRENQIALRASYLEKDNALLKEELLNVKEELQAMREQLLLVQQGNHPRRSIAD